jgi:Lon protease-like protein
MSETELDTLELNALSVFPLPNAALFPGAVLPLHVFEARYRDLVRDALSGSKTLAIARLKPGFESDYEGRPPVHEVCGVGRIIEHVAHRDGRYHILLRGISRVRIVRELPPATLYRVVSGELIGDLPVNPALGSALEQKIHQLWSTLGPELPDVLRDLGEVTHGAEGAGAFADRVAAVMAGDAELGQTLLAEPDPCERLRMIAERLQTLTDSFTPVSRSGLN